MGRLSRTLIVTFIGACLVPLCVQAQDPPTATSLEQEFRVLNQRAGEVIELMRQMMHQQAEEYALRRLEIAIQAVELRSQAMRVLESRIQELEDRNTQSAETVAAMKAESTRIQDIMDDSETPEDELTNLGDIKSRIDTQTELEKSKLWNLESSILDLQNELADRQRDLDSLEEFVVSGLNEF